MRITIEEFNLYKILKPVTMELRLSFLDKKDPSFDMYNNYETWSDFINSLYIHTRKTPFNYMYCLKYVINNTMFVENFNKILTRLVDDTYYKNMIEFQNFHRNSYILFLLQIKNGDF